MKKIMIIGIIVMLVSISFVSNVNSVSIKKEVEDEDNIKILNEPPRTWYELDPAEPNGKNGWYNTNVKVSLFAWDENGIRGIYYKCCSWITYTSPLTISTEGENCIMFKAIDNLGMDSEIKWICFKINKKRPECELIKNRTSLTDIKFTVKAGGSISGVELVELYVDDVLYDSKRPNERYRVVYDFNWTGIGKHEVKAIAYSHAGWITESETLYTNESKSKDLPTSKSKSINTIFDRFPLFSRLFNFLR